VDAVLLGEVIRLIDGARRYALSEGLAVDVIAGSWEALAVPSGMENMVFPYHHDGHLNILLQLSKILNIYKQRYPDEKVLVCLLEHDVLYHETYLHGAARFFEQGGAGRTGVNARGFIGLNQTGYCADKWKHYPLSMMSVDLDYLLPHVEEKIQECLVHGVCVIEPDRKLLDDCTPGHAPAIHVNCNLTGRSHHFTNHYDSYEKESSLPAEIAGWPHATYYTERFFGVSLAGSTYSPAQPDALLPDDLVFVNAQPARGKFLWQIEIQLLNFADRGIPQDRCYFVMINQGGYPQSYYGMKARWPGVHWFETEDDRPSKRYIPSVRPHALAKLFTAYPELSARHVFYFDSDIIFRVLPGFASMVTDGLCHLSDTVSYTGYEYIAKFGEEYVDAMCSIVGIDRQVVAGNQGNSGGAQYLFAKGVLSPAYWRKVYRDCERMYPSLDAMTVREKAAYDVTRKPGEKDKYTLQHWCTDMWCVLWNLWRMGAVTVCDSRLSFSWATTNISEYEKHAIYHDAGVTGDRRGEMFFKGGFNELPGELDTSKYRTDLCSVKYVEYVKRLIAMRYGGQ
jgi:hypothetical protein